MCSESTRSGLLLLWPWLLWPRLLLRPRLLLGTSLLKLAPHAGAAKYGEQLVEGAVGPGGLIRCSCCRALHVDAGTLSMPDHALRK